MPNGSPNDVGGGLGSVGSISGTTLTITTAATANFAVGQYIYAAGVTPGTVITALGTGTGGAGTYTVNNSQAVASGSITNTNPITTSITGTQRWRTQLAYNRFIAAGITPVVWTWMPTNDSVKVYGASDAVKVYGASDEVRRSYNADARSMGGAGVIVADFDAALSGVTDGAGQVQILAGATTDFIHPNDTGNAILAPILQKAIGSVVYAGAGNVVVG